MRPQSVAKTTCPGPLPATLAPAHSFANFNHLCISRPGRCIKPARISFTWIQMIMSLPRPPVTSCVLILMGLYYLAIIASWMCMVVDSPRYLINAESLSHLLSVLVYVLFFIGGQTALRRIHSGRLFSKPDRVPGSS